MPIERRDIQGAIGPGNFGSRGAAIGVRQQGKGPDLSRLLSAIGTFSEAASKDAAADQQKAMTAAELETQQAIFDNRVKNKGETDADHRTRIDGAIAGVRSKYENREKGWQENLFGPEDKTLNVIDNIHVLSRTKSLKEQMSIFRQNNPGLSSDEYAAQVSKMMGTAFTELQHVTDESKTYFLENANKHAVNEMNAMNQANIERLKVQTLAENQSVTFDLSITDTGDILGVSTAEANDSMEKNEEFHRNFDIRGKQLTNIYAEDMRGVYNRALAATNGDKIQATNSALNYALSIAQETGRPEILDTLRKVMLNKDTSLSRFHSKQIAEAQRSIEIQVESTRRHLQSAQQNRLNTGNAKQYNTLKVQFASLDSILGDDADPELLASTEQDLKRNRDSIMADFVAGKYKGNERQAAIMMDYLNGVEKTMARTHGTAQGNEEFLKGMANGQWSKADHYQWVERMSPENKKRSWDFIQKEMTFDKRQIENELDLEKLERTQAINTQVDANFTKWNVAHNTDTRFIKQMASPAEGQFGQLGALQLPSPAQIREGMNFEVQRALMQLQGDIFKTGESRYPTIEETNQALEPVLKKYDQLFDQRQRIIDTYRDANQRTQELQESGVSQDDIQAIPQDVSAADATRLIDSVQKARTGEISFGETSNIYEAATRGMAGLDDVKTALIVDIKNTDFENVSDIYEFIFSKWAPDLTDGDQLNAMAEVLRRGFERKEIPYENFLTHDGIRELAYPKRVTGMTGGPNASNVLDNTPGNILAKALKDNELITRGGLKRFLKRYPFNTMSEDPKERERLVNEEIEKIQKILGEMNKVRKSKQKK